MSEDKPPIMKSWNQLYAVVLGVHLVLLVTFYLITRALS